MIRVGTSGWNYAPWRGSFYPSDLPSSRWLRWAAERMGALEINATFYGSARPRTFVAWHDQVEDLARERGFRFAVKGSRYITHLKKLVDAETAVANFFASGPLLLGAALGPILWQLPPQLPFDDDRLVRFLSLLPRTVAEAQRLAGRHDERFEGRATTERGPGLLARTRLSHAIEPRHESFREPAFRRLCRRWDTAVVAADTAGRHVALEASAHGLAYARLHGSRKLYASRYHDDELLGWARRIEGWGTVGAHDVYVFFDNDFRAYAPRDAVRLQAILEPSATVETVMGEHGPGSLPL